MRKSTYLFAASAVTLSAALAANFLFTSPAPEPTPTPTPTESPVVIPADLKDSDVLTWDCESEVYKPKTIMLTCGDGGWIVYKIKWQTWTKEKATGTGYFRENLCEPNCAEGKLVEAPVNVTLTDLTPYKGKYYLRSLDIRTRDGKDFPWGKAGVIGWDVMEFGVMMDEYENE